MAQVDLFRKSIETRKTVLKLIHHAKTGHTGGGLSSTDMMVALYYKIMNIDPKNPNMDNRDRFILSKGHSVEPLWTILADLDFYPEEELWSFSSFGSKLIGHPNNKMPGIEMNTGSLGHGLSVGSGLKKTLVCSAMTVRWIIWLKVWIPVKVSMWFWLLVV